MKSGGDNEPGLRSHARLSEPSANHDYVRLRPIAFFGYRGGIGLTRRLGAGLRTQRAE